MEAAWGVAAQFPEPSFSFFHYGCEDGGDLVGFVEKRRKLRLGNEVCGDNETERIVGFASFLQGDGRLGEKIGTALSAFGFLQVRTD